MSRWKIIPGVNLYFVTTTIVEWQNVFVEIPLFEKIIESLKYCCAIKGLHLHGYVRIMWEDLNTVTAHSSILQ
jgi:hypothetical protein